MLIINNINKYLRLLKILENEYQDLILFYIFLLKFENFRNFYDTFVRNCYIIRISL